MRQTVLAMICATTLAASVAGAAADPASDQDMANHYLQAAQSGDDGAEFYVGALYSAGVGLPRSDEEAFRWFSRAAEQGHSHAMLILGGLYAVGRGVAKDNVKAYKWAYIVGSASKVEEFRNGAHQLMGVLETKMTPEQINRARTDASSWHAVPNSSQARLSAPSDTGRNPPPPTTASPVKNPQLAPTVATPQTTPAVSSAPAPPRPGNDQPEARLGKGQKKDDIDNLLDQVPQGLRKKYGF